MRWGNIAGGISINIWRFVCFLITKSSKSFAYTVRSARSWINANSRAGLSRDQKNSNVKDSPPLPIWILPKTEKRAIQRAKDRANQTRWDLDTAIFLFGILVIVFILTYQGTGIWITAPVATFGFIMVWLVGFKKARQSYKMYLPEELVRYPDDWKDYYKILHIDPGSTPEKIASACDRLFSVLKNTNPAYGEAVQVNMLNDAEEAYQVLCAPNLKATYDYIYWSSFNAETYIDAELKTELIELSQSIYEEVVRSSKYASWRIPFMDRISPRAIQATVGFILGVLLIGTTLAFTKPEIALAAPFREVATTIAHASSGAVELLNASREAAASAELKIVSTALQSMRVDERLKVVPFVVAPRNDMAFFPSREFNLYPDYLDRRYSQFRYTVNNKGIMAVDTSWAITDGFLQYMTQVIERIESTE